MIAIPKRVKADGGAKVQQSQQALRDNITTAPEVSESMIRYMKSIQLKRDLGVLNMTDEQLRSLFPPPSVEEKLTQRILINLNKLSTISPQFALIASTYGTSDKLQLARMLAAKQVQALRVRNVTAGILGVESAAVGAFGAAEVFEAMNNQRQADPMGAQGSATTTSGGAGQANI